MTLISEVQADPSVWRQATITNIVEETPTAKTFTFSFAAPVTHLPGQHYEVRLTSEGGYQAARLYSAASVGVGTNRLELTVVLLPGGEVSPYLDEQAAVGDAVEIRGPFGRFFTWQASQPDPILLIGGGSGVVPLRCILNAHKRAQANAPIKLLYSARSYDEIMYKSELLNNPAVLITITGDAPPTWRGRQGRIDAELLSQVRHTFSSEPLCYVCGMTPFVEAMANTLVSIGVPPGRIKAERFGATALIR